MQPHKSPIHLISQTVTAGSKPTGLQFAPQNSHPEQAGAPANRLLTTEQINYQQQRLPASQQRQTVYKRLPAVPMKTQATQTEITAYHLMGSTPLSPSTNSGTRSGYRTPAGLHELTQSSSKTTEATTDTTTPNSSQAQTTCYSPLIRSDESDHQQRQQCQRQRPASRTAISNESVASSRARPGEGKSSVRHDGNRVGAATADAETERRDTLGKTKKRRAGTDERAETDALARQRDFPLSSTSPDSSSWTTKEVGPGEPKNVASSSPNALVDDDDEEDDEDGECANLNASMLISSSSSSNSSLVGHDSTLLARASVCLAKVDSAVAELDTNNNGAVSAAAVDREQPKQAGLACAGTSIMRGAGEESKLKIDSNNNNNNSSKSKENNKTSSGRRAPLGDRAVSASGPPLSAREMQDNRRASGAGRGSSSSSEGTGFKKRASALKADIEPPNQFKDAEASGGCGGGSAGSSLGTSLAPNELGARQKGSNLIISLNDDDHDDGGRMNMNDAESRRPARAANDDADDLQRLDDFGKRDGDAATERPWQHSSDSPKERDPLARDDFKLLPEDEEEADGNNFLAGSNSGGSIRAGDDYDERHLACSSPPSLSEASSQTTDISLARHIIDIGHSLELAAAKEQIAEEDEADGRRDEDNNNNSQSVTNRFGGSGEVASAAGAAAAANPEGSSKNSPEAAFVAARQEVGPASASQRRDHFLTLRDSQEDPASDDPGPHQAPELRELMEAVGSVVGPSSAALEQDNRAVTAAAAAGSKRSSTSTLSTRHHSYCSSDDFSGRPNTNLAETTTAVGNNNLMETRQQDSIQEQDDDELGPVGRGRDLNSESNSDNLEDKAAADYIIAEQARSPDKEPADSRPRFSSGSSSFSPLDEHSDNGRADSMAANGADKGVCGIGSRTDAIKSQPASRQTTQGSGSLGSSSSSPSLGGARFMIAEGHKAGESVGGHAGDNSSRGLSHENKTKEIASELSTRVLDEATRGAAAVVVELNGGSAGHVVAAEPSDLSGAAKHQEAGQRVGKEKAGRQFEIDTIQPPSSSSAAAETEAAPCSAPGAQAKAAARPAAMQANSFDTNAANSPPTTISELDLDEELSTPSFIDSYRKRDLAQVRQLADSVVGELMGECLVGARGQDGIKSAGDGSSPATSASTSQSSFDQSTSSTTVSGHSYICCHSKRHQEQCQAGRPKVPVKPAHLRGEQPREEKAAAAALAVTATSIAGAAVKHNEYNQQQPLEASEPPLASQVSFFDCIV